MHWNKTVLSAIMVTALLASTGEAISSGPGGRLYQAGRYAVSGVNSIRLGSVAVDENWNVDWNTLWTVHGTVTDNAASAESAKKAYGCSPEIVSTTGGGSYATLVLGAHYNRTPLPQDSSRNTMDILRLTTSASGMSVSVLGDGKAYVHGTTGFTEGGVFAFPDRNGGFTGSASNYFVGAAVDDRYRYRIVSDTLADGDLTDDASDYVSAGDDELAYDGITDMEIHGSRAYCSVAYSESGAGEYTFRYLCYYRRETDGSLSRNYFYHDQSIDCVTGGTYRYYAGGLAVGELDGHEAAWGMCVVDNSTELVLFVDRNDDGDAMDSGEYALAGYNSDTVRGTWNDPQTGGYWTDLELITDSKGKMFLLVQDTRDVDDRGRAYLVMELADNGEYAGGADGVKLILWEKGSGDGTRGFTYSEPTGWYMMAVSGNEAYNETEFDATQVPEPATVLLLGTAVLGALVHFRRKHLN